MKYIIHKSDTRGYADHGWLKSHHTFNFAEYHNPERVRFGMLRVLNDDFVERGTGFGTHPHDNMEIVSIPLAGVLAHKDSLASEQIINTGDVQIMSAGSGLFHSEYNASKTEPVNFLQIWIFPKLRDIEPRYEQKSFNSVDRKNKFQTVISPENNNNTMWINQDAYLSIGNLDTGTHLKYDIRNNGNGLYIFVIEGIVEAEGIILGKRDAAGFEDADNINIKCLSNSNILLIDVPMNI